MTTKPSKSPPNAIADALDQQLEKDYTARDRTGLKLPKTQTCDSCLQPLDHTEFSLKKRNQYQAHLPDELESTCKACKRLTKKVTKGLFIKNLSQGSLLLSDTAVEWLNQPAGAQTPIPITTNKQMVIDALGQSIRGGDLEAIKILISLVQGKSASYKINEPIKGEGLEQIETDELPSIPANTMSAEPPRSKSLGKAVDNLARALGPDDAVATSAPGVDDVSVPANSAMSVKDEVEEQTATGVTNPATAADRSDRSSRSDGENSRRRSREASVPLTSPLLDRLIGSS